jgi:nitrile hydratase accessory protein
VSLETEQPFDEPWQARAFALAQNVLETAHLDREEFRARLIAAIAEASDRPYWESWLVALERLVSDHNLVGDSGAA